MWEYSEKLEINNKPNADKVKLYYLKMNETNKENPKKAQILQT